MAYAALIVAIAGLIIAAAAAIAAWLTFGAAQCTAEAARTSAEAARSAVALGVPRVQITTPNALKEYEDVEAAWFAFRVENLSAAQATIMRLDGYEVRNHDAPPFSADRYRKHPERPMANDESVFGQRMPGTWVFVRVDEKLTIAPFGHIDLETYVGGLIDIGVGGVADAAYDIRAKEERHTSLQELVQRIETGKPTRLLWPWRQA